jgi:transposase-like protein
MPNHIHWIIIIEDTVGNEYFRSDIWSEKKRNEYFHSLQWLKSKPNLSNIIKWFKIWCTKEIRNKYEDFNFWWQKSFFDKIIRNDEQLWKTREYILNNPLKWELDVNNPKNIKDK